MALGGRGCPVFFVALHLEKQATHTHTQAHCHTHKRKGGSVPQTNRRHHRGALDLKAVPKGKKHHKYASDRAIHLDIV